VNIPLNRLLGISVTPPSKEDEAAFAEYYDQVLQPIISESTKELSELAKMIHPNIKENQ
jgi:hypothetical protein